MRWHTEACKDYSFMQVSHDEIWECIPTCDDQWREFIAQLRRRIEVNNREATPSAARVNGALLWVMDALEIEEVNTGDGA